MTRASSAVASAMAIDEYPVKVPRSMILRASTARASVESTRPCSSGRPQTASGMVRAVMSQSRSSVRTGGSFEHSVRARSPVVSDLRSAPSKEVTFPAPGIPGGPAVSRASISGPSVLCSSVRSFCCCVNQLGWPGR